jgi:PhoH-like ATPase
MRKFYILDTSTIIYDPKNCFTAFTGNNVIIPIAVLEELDHIKSRNDMGGANARAAIRTLDKFFTNSNPSNGVSIDNDIILSIDVRNNLDSKFNAGGKDDNILSCAASYSGATLISKDVAMRIRARSFGIEAEDYKENSEKAQISDLYEGHRTIELEENYNLAVPFLAKGTVFEDLYPNECVQVIHNNITTIMRRHGDGFMKQIRLPDKTFGLKSKNMEQAFALDLLLDPEVKLVTIAGLAGSGKTILTVAAALEQVLENKLYREVQFYKPIIGVDDGLGYLPGELQQKLLPMTASTRDAISYLAKGDCDSFIYASKEKIKFEAITYLRGRSLNKVLIVVDEVQNISKNEVKTILTRVGFGSKIILLGDIEQIDNTYIDSCSNGLTRVFEAFKDSALSGHVMLKKGERSELATEAAKIL